jgi:hypothetical protein
MGKKKSRITNVQKAIRRYANGRRRHPSNFPLTWSQCEGKKVT